MDWEDGQPNNWGGKEDCVNYHVATAKMRDDECDTDNDVICTVEPQTKFTLKGVCIDSPVDSFYMMTSSTELVGYTQTTMMFNTSEKRWEIVMTRDNTLLAYTTSISEFPIGSHPWYFVDVDNPCTDKNVTWRMLLLHLTVEEPGHFCCGDGKCIDSDYVCDNNQHCDDR